MQTARAGGPAGQQDDQQDSAAEQAVSVPAAQSAITASQLEYLSVAALRRQIRDPDKHAASRPDERSNMETEQLQLSREMLARNLAETGRNAEHIVRLQEASEDAAGLSKTRPSIPPAPLDSAAVSSTSANQQRQSSRTRVGTCRKLGLDFFPCRYLIDHFSSSLFLHPKQEVRASIFIFRVSSVGVDVSPLNLAALPQASPLAFKPATPGHSSSSADTSEQGGVEPASAAVMTPNATARQQQASNAGEVSFFATADLVELRAELRAGISAQNELRSMDDEAAGNGSGGWGSGNDDNNESGERTKFQANKNRNLQTKLEEMAVAFGDDKATNKYRIGEITNRLAQAFTEGNRETQILSPASIPSAATVGFKAAVLTTTTLPESKQMGSDTAVISIATEEEGTPVGLVIAAKEGAGSEQVYWDTVVNSIAAAAEGRQVGFATVANAAGEAGTTTVNSTSAGEGDTQVYTQPAENSADSADCKGGAQFPSPASATPGEKAHAGPLAERGYSIASGASYAGERKEASRTGPAESDMAIAAKASRAGPAHSAMTSAEKGNDKNVAEAASEVFQKKQNDIMRLNMLLVPTKTSLEERRWSEAQESIREMAQRFSERVLEHFFHACPIAQPYYRALCSQHFGMKPSFGQPGAENSVACCF